MGIPTHEIATIGDMPTDVLMFAESGLSIAMGSAGPVVRQSARRITSSNEDEGFASAVGHYVLRDRSSDDERPLACSSLSSDPVIHEQGEAYIDAV